MVKGIRVQGSNGVGVHNFPVAKGVQGYWGSGLKTH